MALIKNPNFNPSLGATTTNQEYIFDNANTVINPTTGQTAGSITLDSLKQEESPTLPKPIDTTTSSQQILSGNKTMAELLAKQMSDAAAQTQKEAEARAKETNPFTEWLSASEKNQGESSTDIYKSIFGEVPNIQQAQQEEIAKKQAYQTAQNEFNLVQNKIRALNDQASAIPLKLQEEATGRGITAGGLAPIQAGELRKVAIQSLSLTPELYASQAKMAQAQGDYESAKTYLSEAKTSATNYFNAILQDKRDERDYQNRIIDKYYDYATNKEQQELDAIKDQNNKNFELYKIELQNISKLAETAMDNGQSSLATQIRALDPNSDTYQQDLANLQGQIQIKQEANTQVVKLDNGATVLINSDTGEVIKNLGGLAPITGTGTGITTGTGGGPVDTSTMSPEAQAVINGTLRLEDLTPTTKGRIAGELMAAGYSSQAKLSSAQQEDLATMDNVGNSLDKILEFNADGKLEGIGSFGLGTLKGWAAQAGFGSEEGKTVRALIGNVKGTIAKLRGGTSFTTNEERLLDTYTPSINDNPSVAINKINLLKQFIADKKKLLYQFAQDRNLPQSNLEADALRSKYNY